MYVPYVEAKVKQNKKVKFCLYFLENYGDRLTEGLLVPQIVRLLDPVTV